MCRDLVTIVVPAYNAEKFLKENIESILGQTYLNIEVIYVCDGCTDGTVEILESYTTDRRLKVIVQSENQGAAIARNIGMELAQGDWIFFWDADDLFEPDMIECMVHTALATGADIVGCYGEYFDEVPNKNSSVNNEMRKVYCKTYPIVNTDMDCSHIFQMIDKSTCTRMVHKSVYQKKEVYFQSVPTSNDVYYSMVTALNAKRIVYVDKVFWHYRSNKGRITLSTTRTEKKNYLWEAFDKIHEYIMSEGMKKRFLQSFYNEVMYQIFSCIQIPVGLQLFDELKDKYLYKWGMTDEGIVDKLSCINKIIYAKILKGDKKIDTSEVYKLARIEWIKKIAPRGCSVWGTGAQGEKLFKSISGRDIQFRYVYDSARDKWGKEFYGYQIENFEAVPTDNIIVTTPIYFEEIRCQIGDRAKYVYNLEHEIWRVPNMVVK